MSELPPSESRRREARAQGRVARSPLASGAGALAGAAFALWASSGAGALLSGYATRMWSGQAEPGDALTTGLAVAARVVLPIALAAWAGGWLIGLAQTRGLFTLGAFGRRKRDPAERAAAVPWALATALVLLAIMAARHLGTALSRAATLDATRAAVLDGVAALLPRALLLLVAAGLGDWAWRRVRLDRSLWMTRAERDRERRQQEADPRLRAEARRRQRS
jgi:flagellar biosynthesis protein FlhB